MKIQTLPDGHVEVTFKWSNEYGECYGCGAPASYDVVDLYGEPAEKSRAERLHCSVCAADHAADGHTLVRLFPDHPHLDGPGPVFRLRRTYATVLRDAVDFRLTEGETIDPDGLADLYERVYAQAVHNEGLANAGRPHHLPAGAPRLAFDNEHVSDETGIDDTYDIEVIG